MEEIIYELLWWIKEAQKSSSIIEVDDRRYDMLSESTLNEIRDLNLDHNIIDLYRSFNGHRINWIADEEGEIVGRMHFLSIEEIVKSWASRLYEEDEVEADADIRFFHPFDLISEEAQCGIIIDPSCDIKSIFYNYSGEIEIYSLDIDFKGYLEMALEAKVFYYWPKVLLDIKNNEESKETRKFKEEMPRIFNDFNFNQFTDKYNSLRISNN